MDAQRWLNIAELYQSALPLTPAERDNFVATNCGSDTVLRQEVRSLLETEETSGEFLNEPVFELGLKLLVDPELKSAERASTEGEPDKLIGTTVDDRYEVVEMLGSGGIGDVYRARDRKILLRTVVIKVLKDSSLSKPWVVAKFEREIEALTKIADAGVVGVIDAGKLPDGKPYLVMEYVEGSDLREFLRERDSANRRLAFEEVAEIVRQVGRTLTSAHEAGVIHRDLKPANIMLRRNASGDFQVKVIDFGIAKITSPAVFDTTTTGLMIGTVAYMAPEQLEAKKVTPASDVYALGIIAYEMITGNKPFNPESPTLLPQFQRAGVNVPPRALRPGLPLAAQAAILKALSYEVASRYQRARDFGDALAEALTADEPVVQTAEDSVTPVEDKRDPSSSSGKSTAPRHLRVSLLGAAVLLPIVLSFTYAWYHRTPTTTFARTLTYSLTVEKPNGQQALQSSGQETFMGGDRFRLNVFSRESGYLYVFNEGAEDGGGTIFTLIYPTPKTNGGSAKHDAPMIQTSWNTFEGPPDKEEFWIVWSASPIEALEDAKNAAMNGDEGRLTSAAMVRRLREFLLQNSHSDLNTFSDTTKQQVELRATSDPLVKLVELEHR